MFQTPLDQIYPVIIQLGCAATLGAIVGVDRDLHNKPAGLRVLSLVSLGCAAVTLASMTVAAKEAGIKGDGVLRTVQGILSGIGFLGAGVIMRSSPPTQTHVTVHASPTDPTPTIVPSTSTNEQVHGITTAAAVWVAAVLGIICGLGDWVVGLVAFGFTLVILVVGRKVERMIVLKGRQLNPTNIHD